MESLARIKGNLSFLCKLRAHPRRYFDDPDRHPDKSREDTAVLYDRVTHHILDTILVPLEESPDIDSGSSNSPAAFAIPKSSLLFNCVTDLDSVHVKKYYTVTSFPTTELGTDEPHLVFEKPGEP